MPPLPVMLDWTGRRVVIAGGGAVAVRRARSFGEAGAVVCVVAPRLDERLASLGVRCHERAFESGDLDGAFAICVATDDPTTNDRIAEEARRRGVLVNRCDDGPAGDFTVPAHASRGRVTLAVDTGGASAATAVRLRDRWLDDLDPGLSELLDVVAIRRAALRDTISDAETRAALLREMTGDEALRILKSQGAAALHAWIDERIGSAGASPHPTHPAPDAPGTP